ncbi:hypothetical protein C0Q70_19279 [Pomacea canaliculata]|uniref:FAD-binding domain-containing protein n=2 Tax=Pomacea canaliculata TaxID=400727 RepID=A0A2T7NIW1_POMCA|nr:hypothetical protein C0Q70_19279 [Pomacea canaliculata]
MLQSVLAIQQLIISAIVVTCFVATKTLLDNYRKRQARMCTVIVGAGPVGLTALMVAAKSGRVSKIVLYEEQGKQMLFNTPHQIAFDSKSVCFLRKLGVDFDNIEGCWDCGCFFTRLGVFLEYMLSVVYRLPVPVEVRLGTKFTRECLRELEGLEGRKMVIACDGANGQTGRHLGLSDEYTQHSCRFYGAVAMFERTAECQIPLRERRQHNLHFDLTAYGADSGDVDGHQGFSLKIFGTSRHRYLTLVIPKCETPLVKALRVVLDRSMMRNIFLKCFNTYKSESESTLSDSYALKHMKFSPRLFEIKLSQRLETAAYFQDMDIFVVAEGEAARCYNINTGLDVNIGIQGLQSLQQFLDMAAVADSEHSILTALALKSQHAEQVCKDFLRNGLREQMMT